MNGVSRRRFVKAGSLVGAFLASPAVGRLESQAGGFTAASNPEDLGHKADKSPGIQYVYALCEVTGGGQKVYGIAVQYDAPIDPASLSLDTYTAGVFPAARGGPMAGGPGGQAPPGSSGGGASQPDVNASVPNARPVTAIYTNQKPGLLPDRRGIPGACVIVEFARNPDLSAQSTDSDKVSITQARAIRTTSGAIYAASAHPITNAGGRGNDTVVRGIDAWEQNHWWWDDSRATWLEYSIALPRSFLKPGGEDKAYPLVIAITHSGTSYTGTCLETLTDGVIASIWAMPEQQAEHECVVITPRYERTTMNDYWEHTSDVENTYRLVEFLLSNRWNFGNPNNPQTADKVLRIDPKRVYTTGWSMGAMTSLWMMAKHPETFAAGLIIAGQQRPGDMVTLAHQNVLILTGAEDGKATPWNEKCVPVWRSAGAKVTRPSALLDPASIFPIDDQRRLTSQIDGYLDQGGNITFLTFAGVDHMGSARKFFYIKAARDWLFRQSKI